VLFHSYSPGGREAECYRHECSFTRTHLEAARPNDLEAAADAAALVPSEKHRVGNIARFDSFISETNRRHFKSSRKDANKQDQKALLFGTGKTSMLFGKRINK
jgi:hypothetical protein